MTSRGSWRALSACRMSSSRRNCCGPATFNNTVHRWSYGDPANRSRHIFGCDRLNEHGRKPYSVAIGRIVSDAPYELEELGGMDDRVGSRCPSDQLLLSDLRPEVAALGQAFGSHDGQRDVMPDGCGRFGVDEVAGRRLEEFLRRGALERWSVRHVDDHVSTVQSSRKPVARKRVHARPR